MRVMCNAHAASHIENKITCRPQIVFLQSHTCTANNLKNLGEKGSQIELLTRLILLYLKKMVCPLRYIVAGVSILVALIVLLWTNNDSNKRTLRAAAKVQQRKSFFIKVVDMFTGRYLLDRWAEVRSGEGIMMGGARASVPTAVKLMAD